MSRSSTLRSKDPSRQELLDLLLKSGFIRYRIRESNDPTVVSKVIYTKGKTSIVVDLLSLSVEIKSGNRFMFATAATTDEIPELIRTLTSGMIVMVVNANPKFDRYGIGRDRYSTQTANYWLN